MEPRFLDGHACLADAESHIGLEFDLDRRGFVRLVVGKYLEPGYGFISQRIGNLRLGGFHIGLELNLSFWMKPAGSSVCTIVCQWVDMNPSASSLLPV